MSADSEYSCARLQPHVGAQQAHGGLAAQRAEELGRRTLGLRELGAAHDALEIVE